MNTDFTSIASVDADLRAICVELPDRLNPTTSGSDGCAVCVYENAEGEHCIVGELLYRNGLLTTEIIKHNNVADYVGEYTLGFDRDVAWRMRQWQTAADTGSADVDRAPSTNPIAWGQIPGLIEAFDKQYDKEHND